MSARTPRYEPSLYPRERRLNPFIHERRLSMLGIGMHGGRLLSALQLPWFSVAPPRGYRVLTTTGWRSGRQRRKCVRAIRRGEQVYVVSIAGTEVAWFKNIRADPRVTLRIRGGTFAGRARELTSPHEVERALSAYVDIAGTVDYLACMNWRKGRPTRSKIEDLARGWFEEGAPLVVELTSYAVSGESSPASATK
jgi:deazaflavin-dependent oxidoreductase (nitroreductase family)